jgi:hypothetical protein
MHMKILKKIKLLTNVYLHKLSYNIMYQIVSIANEQITFT